MFLAKNLSSESTPILTAPVMTLYPVSVNPGFLFLFLFHHFFLLLDFLIVFLVGLEKLRIVFPTSFVIATVPIVDKASPPKPRKSALIGIMNHFIINKESVAIHRIHGSSGNNYYSKEKSIFLSFGFCLRG